MSKSEAISEVAIDPLTYSSSGLREYTKRKINFITKSPNRVVSLATAPGYVQTDTEAFPGRLSNS